MIIGSVDKTAETQVEMILTNDIINDTIIKSLMGC